jgi:CRP-like cAMP-binding protein
MKKPQQVQASALGLRRIALLEGLSDAALDDLARRCAWRHFDADQQIISREADDGNVYFIVSGRVRVMMYSRSGRQVTFGDQVAGEFLGESSAIDGQPRSLDVVALESTLVASLTPAGFSELSTLGVQNRIHAELLRLAAAAGVKGNAARIDPAPTHAEIASRISTNREQVTRELSALMKAGLLAKDGGAVRVLDVQRLERMVADVRAEV